MGIKIIGVLNLIPKNKGSKKVLSARALTRAGRKRSIRVKRTGSRR